MKGVFIAFLRNWNKEALVWNHENDRATEIYHFNCHRLGKEYRAYM